CVARFAYERKIAPNADMVFETLGGSVHASVKDKMATLKLAPVSLKDVKVDAQASVNGETFNYTFLTVGVPHTVIFEKEKRTDDEYREFGRAVRNMSELFPEGTNVNFAVPREENGVVDVTTYERGVEDLTLSCGTGSTASAIASVLIGLSGPKVDVWNPGGLNRVAITFESSDVALPELTGKAVYVADLKITDETMQTVER
ncbi:MAG: diaminopimelate epimerase, partial [Synergistaceae bacterium]|nr:diaminopimelate epimerase [Synergistaceae bacterium]